MFNWNNQFGLQDIVEEAPVRPEGILPHNPDAERKQDAAEKSVPTMLGLIWPSKQDLTEFQKSSFVFLFLFNSPALGLYANVLVDSVPCVFSMQIL